MNTSNLRLLRESLDRVLVEDAVPTLSTVPTDVKLYGPVEPKSGVETASFTSPDGGTGSHPVKYGYFVTKEPKTRIQTADGSTIVVDKGTIVAVGRVETLVPMSRQDFEANFKLDVDLLRDKVAADQGGVANTQPSTTGYEHLQPGATQRANAQKPVSDQALAAMAKTVKAGFKDKEARAAAIESIKKLAPYQAEALYKMVAKGNDPKNGKSAYEALADFIKLRGSPRHSRHYGARPELKATRAY